MIRLSWLGAAVAVGAMALPAGVSGALAQQELEDPTLEIITEPPSQPEAPPAETPAERPAEPEGAPEEPPPKVVPPKKKPGQLRVGAGIGFGFATNLITFGISPQVSYIFKKIVEPGVAVRYQYTNDRVFTPSAVWHTFGGSIFVRLYPIQPIFVLVEGELINTGFKQGDVSSGRSNYGNLFLGGGYIQGVGRGAFIAMSIKVNVFRNPFYPSNIPIFGVGAGFGF